MNDQKPEWWDVADGSIPVLPEHERRRYSGLCWWCGAVADTGEHKFKRTDLVSRFGAGPWPVGEGIAHGTVGQPHLKHPQSTRSDSLKFSNSLCRDCNNVRSQPADNAYSVFSKRIFDFEGAVLSQSCFFWSTMFGRDNWHAQAQDVARFLVKHACCRLADAGVEVPPETVAFLDGTGPNVNFRFEMQIRDDSREWNAHQTRVHGSPSPSEWLDDLMCSFSKSRGLVHDARSFKALDWLRICWLFSIDEFGDDPLFGNDLVMLSRHRNLSSEKLLSMCADCFPVDGPGGLAN